MCGSKVADSLTGTTWGRSKTHIPPMFRWVGTSSVIRSALTGRTTIPALCLSGRTELSGIGALRIIPRIVQVFRWRAWTDSWRRRRPANRLFGRPPAEARVSMSKGRSTARPPSSASTRVRRKAVVRVRLAHGVGAIKTRANWQGDQLMQVTQKSTSALPFHIWLVACQSY